MKLFFDDKIPKAEKEYKKIMSNKDIAREKRIIDLITTHGLQKVPPEFAKHLWDDIYEIKPDNKRIILIKITQDEGVILKVYVKQSNKMPKHIKDAIIERAKILRNPTP